MFDSRKDDTNRSSATSGDSGKQNCKYLPGVLGLSIGAYSSWKSGTHIEKTLTGQQSAM